MSFLLGIGGTKSKVSLTDLRCMGTFSREATMFFFFGGGGVASILN